MKCYVIYIVLNFERRVKKYLLAYPTILIIYFLSTVGVHAITKLVAGAERNIVNKTVHDDLSERNLEIARQTFDCIIITCILTTKIRNWMLSTGIP